MEITKYGYFSIQKSAVNHESLKKMTNDLTIISEVSPQIQKKYFTKPKKTVLLMETKNTWQMPRFYGLKTFGRPDRDLMLNGEDISDDVQFAFSLRENQHEPVNKVLDQFLNTHFTGGLLSLPCGEGKTVSALYIVSKIRRKTLIVVHAEFLMLQWLAEIREFLPNARVGFIQGDKFDIQNKDIVIAMIQTLSKRPYTYDDLCSFGMSIYDECHHLGATMFSKALQKVPSRFMLGLSAEPIRKDGMNAVFEHYIGDVIFSRERKNEFDVRVYQVVTSSNSSKYEECLDARGEKALYKMEENIVTFTERNQMITDIISQMLTQLHGRQILVLSARNEGHLPLLYRMITEKIADVKIGYYIGRNGRNKEEYMRTLEESKKCQVILGTYDMAMEGLNIKTLNTIILASPLVGLKTKSIRGEKKTFCNDIKQSIGRILRDKENDVPRIIIDINDTFGNYIEWSRQRKRYYEKEGYAIRKVKYDLDSQEPIMIQFKEWEQQKITSFQCINTSFEDSDDNDNDNNKPSTSSNPVCMIRL
jgi:superfamily II DNA or RNA helicase